MGIDRDLDGSLVYDRDEIDSGTDPANAGSVAGACGDGIDNDSDGFTDFGPGNDPGCASASSSIENPACDDGLDNDGNGLIDLADPTCANASDLHEGSSCGDGVVDPGEQCDGSTCCSASCQFEVVGAACSDGDACTAADSRCDGAGACLAGGPVGCDDGSVLQRGGDL